MSSLFLVSYLKYSILRSTTNLGTPL